MTGTTTSQYEVCFLCRGSVQDGLGHVVRSRTIALELNKVCRVSFHVIGDRNVYPLLFSTDLNFTIHSSIDAAIQAIKNDKPSLIVFDLIALDTKYFSDLSSATTTISLSPIFNQLDKTDIFFNRTKYLSEIQKQLPGKSTIVKAGLQYSIIRESCHQISTTKYKENLYKEPLSIAISMGGVDASNKTLEALRCLRDVSAPLLVWVLLGEGYGHSYRAIVDAGTKDTKHEIILAKTNLSMWRIIESCSLVLLAGGTVTYEAAYARIPSLNIFEDPKHTFLTKELEEHGAAISLGFPVHEALVLAKKMIVEFEDNREKLLTIHRNCKDLIPNTGRMRVAQEILSILNANTKSSFPARSENRCGVKG